MTERRPHPSSSRTSRKPATRTPRTSTANNARSASTGAKAAPKPVIRKGGVASGSRPVRKVTYTTTWRLPVGSTRKRLNAALAVLTVLILVCAGRLVQVQVFDTHAYAVQAAKMAGRTSDIPAQRGTIVDRNGVVLVETESAANVIVDPVVVVEASTLKFKKDIEAKRKTRDEAVAEGRRLLADMLAKHLGGSPSTYAPLIATPDTHWVIVKKQVPSIKYRELAEEVYAADLGGVFRENAPVRRYPAGALAAPVIGFVNQDGKGGAGLEYFYDQQLAGRNGSEYYEVTALGRMPVSSDVIKPAVNGTNYALTIDADLQAQVEYGLNQTVSNAAANWGIAIVMNVKTGEIIAMANTPGFDPNNYGAAKPEDLGNRAVSAMYEPGSVEKVITMASLLDAGLITPDTQVVVPERLKSGDYWITDVTPHGVEHRTARGILVDSSNIGTALLAQKMPKSQFIDYLEKFGYGRPTGIELPGEASGQYDRRMSDDLRDRAAFGQSMSVTAVQITAALAAIANGGVYNPPTIIKSATDANGNPVTINRSAPRRVVSQQAAEGALNMMENLVSHASTDRFTLPGYRVGAKTGTAERFEPTCGCYKGYTVSFTQVAPIENPQFVTYVVVDNPTQNGMSGGITAAPLVRDTMRVVMSRYGIKFSTTPTRVDQLDW